MDPHTHTHDAHHHDHGDLFHSHAPVNQMQKAFWLTVIVLAVEVIGGLWSHSLALMSDAGHVLTDLAAIGLTWYALVQSRRPASSKMTFGYHRSGILAAFLNGLLLFVITVIILWEAISRFGHPTQVHGIGMFISAAVGLGVNLYLGLGLRHEENINVQSTVLHMLGDAIASAAVIVGGIVIALTGWTVVDPILSILISILIAIGAWRIVKRAVFILMEGTPNGIDVDKVVESIRSVPGIVDVHDVHVWCITSGKNALSCHVVVDGQLTVESVQGMLRAVEHRLTHLGVNHATIQTEDANHPHERSVLCSDDVNVHEHAESNG